MEAGLSGLELNVSFPEHYLLVDSHIRKTVVLSIIHDPWIEQIVQLPH